MQNNVVIAIFDVESEAYQAFSELKNTSAGEGYVVPEAVLFKNENGTINVIDGFTIAPPDSGTTKGIVIGSLMGIIGGPIGVILGATYGASVGMASDAGRALGNASVVAVVASKVFEGEIAIAALVGEDEPAFDAAFANFKTTIVRYDAADVADDVDRLYELETEISNQVLEEVKADRKAARADRREERRARIKTQLEEYADATNRAMGDVMPM